MVEGAMAARVPARGGAGPTGGQHHHLHNQQQQQQYPLKHIRPVIPSGCCIQPTLQSPWLLLQGWHFNQEAAAVAGVDLTGVGFID
jgi:hypothetical protein